MPVFYWGGFSPAFLSILESLQAPVDDDHEDDHKDEHWDDHDNDDEDDHDDDHDHNEANDEDDEEIQLSILTSFTFLTSMKMTMTGRITMVGK